MRSPRRSLARQPAAHRVARRLAIAGVRGASWYWRLAEVFVPYPVRGLVRVAGGLPVFLDPADWSSLNAYRGLYERGEVAVVRALIAPGDTIVDVGANVGYLTAIFAWATGPSGRVIAFEPSSRLHSALEQLCALPGLSEVVEVHDVALGDRPGTAVLRGADRSDHSGVGSLRPDLAGQGEEVVVERLDDILGRIGVNRLALLKIDVEGFEPQVLAGAEHLLASSAPACLLLEVTPEWGGTAYAAALIERLAGSHDAFVVTERGRIRARPMLLPVAPGNVGSLTGQFNLLVVRRDRVARIAQHIAL